MKKLLLMMSFVAFFAAVSVAQTSNAKDSKATTTQKVTSTDAKTGETANSPKSNATKSCSKSCSETCGKKNKNVAEGKAGNSKSCCSSKAADKTASKETMTITADMTKEEKLAAQKAREESKRKPAKAKIGSK